MGTEKALIFGSCRVENWSFLQPYLQWPDLVIAADGGMELAREAGFSPNFYIGDGDSGGRAEEGVAHVVLPVEKDVTDLEAAYQWARDHGVRELCLTGCTGGRLDHHMAAMGLLETAAREHISATILDPWNRVRFLLPGSCQVDPGEYHYFSLLPVDPVLGGLTIRNAKYELTGRDVRRGDSLTVSNEFLEGPVELSFQTGCCYLIESNETR